MLLKPECPRHARAFLFASVQTILA